MNMSHKYVDQGYNNVFDVCTRIRIIRKRLDMRHWYGVVVVVLLAVINYYKHRLLYVYSSADDDECFV